MKKQRAFSSRRDGDNKKKSISTHYLITGNMHTIGGSLRIVAAELGRALLKAVTSVGSVGGKGRAVLLLFLRNQFVKGGDLLNQLIRK